MGRWVSKGERGRTCVAILREVNGYLAADAARGSYYKGDFLFRSHGSCIPPRIFRRAQCVMNDGGVG